MTPLLLRSGAVQLLRLPWKKAERIVALAGLVESVLVGSPVGWETSTAVDVSGLWDVQAHEWSTSGTDLVAGGPRAGEGLRHRLGSGRRRVGEDSSGSVSVYLQERFGFSPSCKVTPCTSDHRPLLPILADDVDHPLDRVQSSCKVSPLTSRSVRQPATSPSRLTSSISSRSRSQPFRLLRRFTRRSLIRRSG